MLFQLNSVSIQGVFRVGLAQNFHVGSIQEEFHVDPALVDLDRHEKLEFSRLSEGHGLVYGSPLVKIVSNSVRIEEFE